MPKVMERIEGVRRHRLESSRETTRQLADTPTLFGENRQPASRYLAIPSISSERRRYIPMAFLEPEVIGSNKLLFVPGASDYHFGILTSAMHTAWVKVVTGRLKSDFQYSNKLVYNNYPWPDPTYPQRTAIEQAAQAVLDARAPHLAAGASLADLYDPLTMPAALLKAHQALDRAVDQSYRAAVFTRDRERVEFLFARYEKLTAPLAPSTTAKPKRAKKISAAGTVAYPTQADLDSGHIYFGAKEDPPPRA